MQVQDIRYLKGVGPKRGALFSRLGITTTHDLLYYFPFRYEDRTHFSAIKDVTDGGFHFVKGEVTHATLKPFKFKQFRKFAVKNTIFEITLNDESASILCVWFNQGYLAEYIHVGDEVLVYGKVRRYRTGLQFVAPEFETLSGTEDDSLHMGRIVGFYSLTKGITQKTLRKAIHNCLKMLTRTTEDPLPYEIRKKLQFTNIVHSLNNIHFPVSQEEASRARERFIFQELFFSQIMVYLRKAKHRMQKTSALRIDGEILKRLRGNLGFTLTASQEQAIGGILNDLAKPCPMHRLLQGDVGSGKTVVAAFAIAAAVGTGFQVAFMVPTQVIVSQHVTTLKKMFKGFRVAIEALSSSVSAQEKERIYKKLKSRKPCIIVGTHALLQETVQFANLGLVVIDEQHKFGVAQRALLPKKGKIAVHCLVMSATPIPRSLALSLYGDLDLTLIKDLPPQRKEPHTIWVLENKRKWVYDFIRTALEEGRQAYIVYPVIEESDMLNLKSLTQMCGALAKEFSTYTVEIFHGKMHAKEKEEVIQKFRTQKIHILIATTVIEVGVNIENATVMLVENPERFGLAQLHQLRGRIRRSQHQPHFILLSRKNLSENAKARLTIIANVSDGFVIAEEDLKLRGPGDFFGRFQSGYPQLKVANPLRDLEILKQARSYAYEVVKKDPELTRTAHRMIRDYLSYAYY